MTTPSFVRTGERTVHQGYIWHVAVADFIGPDGEPFQRDIVRSPGAVGVVPLLAGPDGWDVVMVRQYRAAFERELIELPAGMRDVEGEPPESTAQRELAEEVGYRAGSMEHLATFLPSPGMTDSTAQVFLATDLSVVPREAHGVEEVHMEVLHVPFSGALAMVGSGEINNAMAVIGLMTAARRLGL